MRTFPTAASLLLCALLTGCGSTTPNSTAKASNLVVDRSIDALAQSSRVRHIVLHYTAANTEDSLHILSQHNVSSHYLITDEQPPKLYQLVDENRRAWHAGVSKWGEHTDLNTSSIGIEIVNAGPLDEQHWAPYRVEQIAMLTELLHELVQRHRVTPNNIVAHSDIAPQRKLDPGPAFPWKQLAQQGLGRWYDAERMHAHLSTYQHALPSLSHAQQQLALLGYEVPLHGQLDGATKNVLRAFQMHYRPRNYDGHLDAETAAIIDALVKGGT